MITEPLVMGIVNATPDSFFTSHATPRLEMAHELARKMIAAGADIIDIGGQSTRPGSERIGPEEELERVIPLIKKLADTNPGTILSIDTYHRRVAEAAVAAGASIVNDISSGDMDPEMIPCVAQMNVPYICMHMKGTPATMHKNPQYEDVVREVLDYFIQKTSACKTAGIKDVIIDPGFGFGKTTAHNFALLKSLQALSIVGRPILAGLSRKATIYKTLDITADEALNGTTALHTIALLNGANLLRVHDVKEAKEAICLIGAYQHA